MVLFYSFLIVPFLTFIRGFVIKNPLFVSSIELSKPLPIETNILDFRGYPTSYQVQKSKTPNSKPAILFIHGFASSSYHWRYNLPAFSENYDTYAIDLIGFGNSAKPTELAYTIPLWSEQVTEFIDRVIQKPCILVGNSLGSSIALYSGFVKERSKNPNIQGIILINPVAISKKNPPLTLPYWFSSKPFIKSYFYLMKTRISIEFLLKSIYPIFPDRVDQTLVDSIENPSKETNASEVFYSIVKENILMPTIFIEDIVENLSNEIPVSIIYGTKDPWITKEMIGQISDVIPHARLLQVHAGHCPQDEIPEIVNPIIESCMTKNP